MTYTCFSVWQLRNVFFKQTLEVAAEWIHISDCSWSCYGRIIHKYWFTFCSRRSGTRDNSFRCKFWVGFVVVLLVFTLVSVYHDTNTKPELKIVATEKTKGKIYEEIHTSQSGTDAKKLKKLSVHLIPYSHFDENKMTIAGRFKRFYRKWKLSPEEYTNCPFVPRSDNQRVLDYVVKALHHEPKRR